MHLPRASPQDLRNARGAVRLNALGLRYKARGQYARARTCYTRALELLGGIATQRSDSAATLCHNLGGIEHALGNYRTAEIWARRGLRFRVGVRAPDAVSMAGDQAALAAILDGLEQYEEAERLYGSALDTYEAASEPQLLEIAHVLGNLGAHFSQRGQWRKAVNLLEQSTEFTRRLLGAAHPDLAVSFNNLAVTLRRVGEAERAAAVAAEALGILERALGPVHPWTVACRRNLH